MPLKRFFHKIHIYKLLIKTTLKKALLNAFYSSLIVFLSSLAAQLQNTQQITIITVITAFLIATVTFLTELRENYPLFKLLVEYKVAEKEFQHVLDILKFSRLLNTTMEHEGND